MSATSSGALRAHLPFIAALAAACAAPEARPLDLERVAADVAERGATPAELEHALELADLQGLGLERPPAALLSDSAPDHDAGPFWHASALAFNGALRDARRRFAEASAAARAAGAPDAMQLGVDHMGIHSDDSETGVALTFDVLGLFDAGRAAAASALSDAEARAAWADVERAAWDAHNAVDRARAELAATRARQGELAGLLQEVAPSLRRAELLYDLGRLSDGAIERLRATALEVEHELHVEVAREAGLRRALADAAGLPPAVQALDEVTRRTLDALFGDASASQLAREPAQAALAARELLERNPEARRARLGYALAEARLRDEAARTQPGLRLGPRVVFQPDDVLPGGLLMLELPHGRALRGRIDAAEAGRERAREALEEVLRAALARVAEARTRFAAAREALEVHALPRAAATGRALAAARARFDVDPSAAEGVGMALQERARALLGALDVRLDVVLAWIDGRAAVGPERSAPERSAPERSAPERSAPERSANGAQPGPATAAVVRGGVR